MSGEDVCAMAWYKMKRRSDSLVLVEDQVSAIKLAPTTHVASLLGTHIGDDKMQEIRAGNYKKIYLCLDNDATYEAIKMVLKWSNKLPQMVVVPLMKDIKDMTNEEFAEFLPRIA